jgi:anti-anti-sigma regulatory factor
MKKQFDLPAELTIYSAVESRDALLAWVAKQGSGSTTQLSINAHDVSVIDGAGLQLLTSLANMELPLKFLGSSSAFTEACQTMGLSAWLAPADQPKARKIAS